MTRSPEGELSPMPVGMRSSPAGMPSTDGFRGRCANFSRWVRSLNDSEREQRDQVSGGGAAPQLSGLSGQHGSEHRPIVIVMAGLTTETGDSGPRYTV